MTTLMLASALAAATNLPPVVVEASRLDATRFDLPAAVRVIARDEIAASGARDAVDLLARQTSDIAIRQLGGANPALAEIALRSYGENGHGRTLVLVDGERLNSPDLNAPNLSRIPLGAVSRIEILGGAQSVLQGDGASAGVINVITEPDSCEQKSHVAASVGSWGTASVSAGTRGGSAEDRLTYWADADGTRSDGYRDHSGFDIANVNGGIRKHWKDGTFLRLSGFYNDARYDLPGALSHAEWHDHPRRSHAFEDTCHRATYGFNTTFRAQLDEVNALRITVNFSERLMSTYQKGSTGGYAWTSDLDYDILAGRLLAEWINTTALAGLDNEFILGVQTADDRLDGRTDSSGAVSHYLYNRATMDAYAHDTLRLTDAISLQLGARGSRSFARNSLASPRRRNDNLTAADLAIVFNPTDRSKLYAKAAQSYRAPFLDETPYDTRTWKPGRLLDPEIGWSGEAGFDATFADGLSFGADVFAAALRDEIFYDPTEGNNINADDTTLRHGADARLAWERDKVAGLSLAATWTRGTFLGGRFRGNDIPLVAETSVRARARIWIWDACSVFGDVRCESARTSCSDFENSVREIPGFAVFSLGATYEADFAEWAKGLKISFVIDNLFDRNYCTYSTYGTEYYPAAGRSLAFTVRYDF